MLEVCVVIPTYHEEKNIVKLIPILFNTYNNLKIVVVDDSLNNLTIEVVNKMQSTYSNLFYIKRYKKMGRYSAIIEGMKFFVNKNVNFNYFVEMDADFSHPPEQISNFIKLANEHQTDILIASREVKGGKIVGWPLFRYILHHSAALLCKIFITNKIYDFFSAYRVYSKNVVTLIISNKNRKFNGFWGFGETLVDVIINEGVIKEVPFTFKNRLHGKSSISIITIIVTIFEIIAVGYIKLKKKTRLKN